MPTQSSNNWTVVSNILAVVGIVVACVFFVAPLKTLPDDMKSMQSDVKRMEQTQAVQTELLKKLSEVANETALIRRDLDKATADCGAHQTVTENRVTSLQIRVSRLEKNNIQESD